MIPRLALAADARAEWVELYVASDIAVDTTFFITDQDAPAAGEFAKVFTLPAGTLAGNYVVIHNDGDPANDNATSSPIQFYMGNQLCQAQQQRRRNCALSGERRNGSAVRFCGLFDPEFACTGWF